MTAKNNNSAKIGDFAKVQKAAAKLEEVLAMLREIGTTCGNIDSARVHLGFASDEIENYTNWAVKQYEALDKAIKKVKA